MIYTVGNMNFLFDKSFEPYIHSLPPENTCKWLRRQEAEEKISYL
ncbi:hypothetical protein ACGE0T_19790 [Parabacteroides sp. APC149_11_2_Y6]